jgi:cadmium resistance protein CadD (predicted permease)
VSSNVDDLILLVGFFSAPAFSNRSVVIGQFLGIGGLVVVSAIAALLSGSLPPTLIRLLGVVPLGLGLRQLVTRRDDSTPEPVLEPAQPASSRFRPQILAVAGTTVANGGDNLGIYIPLFAASAGWIPLFAVLFAGLTAMWCWLAFSLATHRLAAPHLARHARRWLPLVLVGLGLYILFGTPAT